MLSNRDRDLIKLSAPWAGTGMSYGRVGAVIIDLVDSIEDPANSIETAGRLQTIRQWMSMERKVRGGGDVRRGEVEFGRRG